VSGFRFTMTIPEVLVGVVEVSEPYGNYTAKGSLSSHGIDLTLNELNLHKSIKSREPELLPGKIDETLRSWEIKYQKHLENLHKEGRASSVEEMNEEVLKLQESLNTLLDHTLGVNDEVDWSSIKRKDAFRITPKELIDNDKVLEYVTFNSYGRPIELTKKDFPQEPLFDEFRKNYGLFSKLFFKSKISKDFDEVHTVWASEVEGVKKENDAREKVFNIVVSSFDKKKEEFEQEKQKDNEILENIQKRYQESDPVAIEEYCDLVMECSEYPELMPRNWTLEYRPESKMVVIDLDLPSPNQIPMIESYKYVKTKDEVVEKHFSAAAHKKQYDNVIYQICIRTIHELFEADSIDALEAVAFNGLVTSTNPATGIVETKTIISVSAKKEDFMSFDLAKVDPKATFKHLKGVSAASLIDLTPIPPVVKLDKTDKRFIEGKEVAAHLDYSVNIAAMDWEDFEHLVRELLEKEFIANGGEVKVTQASSDGGVDAIAFDPDPIRGGKIVIQAKRYTNTVGVSAVRDLYGTVMNEGATKGILVTTSNYGSDSYDFAKDKPISLINGNNLLSLLEKHGHKAYINVAEAKKLLNS
jgi:restriction system protein